MNHGLSFSWARTGGNTLIVMDNDNRRWASPQETELIERVEALSEAAERARLLVHMLPERMNAAVTVEGAYQTLSSTLYETESALHFVLTGKEAVLEHSEANPNVSGEDSGA